MKNLYSAKEYVETSLYSAIVDITNDDENIDYESIDNVIKLAIDLIATISWDCAVDFVKEDMKKLFKENKINEVSTI